jgi:hypothetical protein
MRNDESWLGTLLFHSSLITHHSSFIILFAGLAAGAAMV